METTSDTSEYIKNDKNVQYLYDSSIISRMNEMIYDHRNCVQHFHDKLFIWLYHPVSSTLHFKIK